MANPTCDLILKILYASEEEKIVIDEAGNVEVTPLNAPANEEMKEWLNKEWWQPNNEWMYISIYI